MNHFSILLGVAIPPELRSAPFIGFLGPRHTATTRDSSGVAEAAAAADATLLVLEIHMGIGV